MKLVIEIPESIYKKAQDGELSEFDSCYINGVVADGKPLSKEHGDLIDKNAIIEADKNSK